MYFYIYLQRGFFIYITMNRDIIKEFDIKYRVNGVTNETEPYINLKVEIDDKDFDAEYGAYIEDIKLYNQNTFVNPTNTSAGVSIFGSLYDENKIDKKQKITVSSVDDFFVADTNPAVVVGHYYKNSDVWTAYSDQTGVTQTYSLGTFYYSTESVKYNTLTFADITTIDISKQAIFIPTNKTKVYEIEDLQADPAFAQNFNISDDIIIVSVKIHPRPDDECQSDYVIKVIYNKAIFKKDIIMAIGEIADRCIIPMRLIDLFLRYKAFDVAIEVGDVEYICRLFKIFKHAKGFNNTIEYAPCGCLKH